MRRETDPVSIHILFEHMDDVHERTLFEMTDRIRNSGNRQTQVRVFKLYSKTSTYLFPDYYIRITCGERVAKTLMRHVSDYSTKFCTQPGLRITLEKDGRTCTLPSSTS